MTFRLLALRGLIALLLGALTIAAARHLQRDFIDYRVYELAARHVLEGRPEALYDLSRTTPGGYYYPYFFALIFTPVAALGPVGGRALVCVVFFIAYLVIVACSVRWFPDPATPERSAALALLTMGMSLYPADDAFTSANIGLLLVVLCLGAYRWCDERPAVAGLCLGIAIAFKVYPLVVLGWFVWAYRWRAAGWALIAAALLLFGVPVLANGPAVGLRVVGEQWTMMSHFGSQWPYDGHDFQNLSATAMRYAERFGFDPNQAFRAALVGGPLAVIVFYAPSFLAPAPRSERFDARMFALALALVPVLVPVSWINMALFYCPMLACLAQDALHRRRPGAWIGFLGYVLLYCLTTDAFVGVDRKHHLQRLSVPFAGSLSALLAFAASIVSDHPERFRKSPVRHPPTPINPF